MRAWQTEEMSSEYQSRRDISKESSEQRRKLKKAVHVARQELARARKLDSAITTGLQDLRDLPYKDRHLTDDVNSANNARVRDACDAACGLIQQMRNDTGTNTGRLCSR